MNRRLMKPLRVEERRVGSSDGTELAYHVAGHGAPIFLANGLGGTWRAWQHQIAYLQEHHRFVTWDYRGLYGSEAPRDPEAIRIEDHVEDALAILEAENLSHVTVVSWSMGAQVALELFRRAPKRIRSLVFVNAIAGWRHDTKFDARALRWMLPNLIGGLRQMPEPLRALTRRAARSPETLVWAKRLGLASRTLDDNLFTDLVRSFEGLDLDYYLRVFETFCSHDASDVLPLVDVPSLVISGDRDFFTRREAAETMAQTVRGADLLVVPGGTHYVALEYPELVNLRLEKFLRERGNVA